MKALVLGVIAGAANKAALDKGSTWSTGHSAWCAAFSA